MRAALQDFLRQLQDAQRDKVRPSPPPHGVQPQNTPFSPHFLPKEELQVRVCSLSKQLAEAEAQRDRALRLQKQLAESKEGDGAILGWFSPFGVGLGAAQEHHRLPAVCGCSGCRHVVGLWGRQTVG